MLDTNRFMKSYDDVVNWNLVGKGNVHSFADADIERQAEYTRSEILETVKAIVTFDPVEFLDGVADVFVTLAYKHFMAAHGVIDPVEIEKAIEGMNASGRLIHKEQYQIDQQLLDITLWIRDENDSGITDTSTLCSLIELMELAEVYYEVDIMEVVEHVMASNWSKYPKISDLAPNELANYIQDEVEYITAKNPKFSDIVGTVNPEHGVVVFRADFGQGKILKPSTFWNANCLKFLKEEEVA